MGDSSAASSDDEHQRPSESSGDEAAAAEAGIVAGESTTDSEDDEKRGLPPAWAGDFSKDGAVQFRKDRVVRGRTVQQQRALVGTKVVTVWGGPGRYWTGTVAEGSRPAFYNATQGYAPGKHPRDLYNVVWDARDDQDCAEDQMEDEFEFEELQAAARSYDKFVGKWKAEKAAVDRAKKIGRPAFIPMEKFDIEYSSGEEERTSARRKCTGGAYNISRRDYAEVANDSPSKPSASRPENVTFRKRKVQVNYVDMSAEMAEEKQAARREWLPGPGKYRSIPEFTGPTPGPTGKDGLTAMSTAGECLCAAWPEEYLVHMVEGAVHRFLEAATQSDFKFDSTDRSFGHYDEDTDSYSCSLTTDHWLLYRLSDQAIALCHNTQLPIRLIYSRDPIVSNWYVKRLISHEQRNFCVRYGYKPDIGALSETKAGDPLHDQYRFNRMAVNLLQRNWRMSWNCHQHTAEDEKIKRGKHWRDKRIRMNKPNVHSGKVLHGKADAIWPYMWYLEEEGWRKNQAKDKVYRRMFKRIQFRNHITWKDRAYAMCNADEEASVNKEVHSAGTIMDNSADVPTQEIKRLKQECPPFHYAVLHKGNTEIVVGREAEHKKAVSIYSTVHSARRTVTMPRGMHKQRDVIEIQVPECWGDFSNCLRSGVDDVDAEGHKYPMATRRMIKSPYKSTVFYEDQSVDNKCTIFKFFNQSVTIGDGHTQQLAWTKTEFLLAALHDVCDGITMRSRAPYSAQMHNPPRRSCDSKKYRDLEMVAGSPGEANEHPLAAFQSPRPIPSGPNPNSPPLGRVGFEPNPPEHELKAFQKGEGRLVPGRESDDPQSTCCYKGCRKKPVTWCLGCLEAGVAKCYCLAHFFKTHTAQLRS